MFGVTDKGIEGHVKSMSLPKRSEIIVELPIKEGEDGAEGIIDKLEIAEEIFVASSLTFKLGIPRHPQRGFKCPVRVSRYVVGRNVPARMEAN
jgi:hypothetical protein